MNKLLNQYEAIFNEITKNFETLSVENQRLTAITCCRILQSMGMETAIGSGNDKDASALISMIDQLNNEQNPEPETNVIQLFK